MSPSPSGTASRHSRARAGSPVTALLFFDAMITPKIITFIYWLLLLATGVWGIAAMISSGHLSFSGFATGLAILVGGALGARVACELMVVLFKINEHIQAVAQRL